MQKIYPQKLLVEGNDDLHIVWSLCEKFNIEENFNVIDSKGYNNLLLRIEAELLQSELKTLGLIIDADNDIQSRWAGIKNKFEMQGYELPESLPANGLIVSHPKKPKLGIWIMPNNQINGAIEDFIKYLIPMEDDIVSEVESSLQILKEAGKQRCKDIHIQKAFICTWLAWQKTPGVPMGQAITFKFLNTEDVQELNYFINWLNNLFE
jgi:hypothetical protein